MRFLPSRFLLADVKKRQERSCIWWPPGRSHVDSINWDSISLSSIGILSRLFSMAAQRPTFSFDSRAELISEGRRESSEIITGFFFCCCCWCCCLDSGAILIRMIWIFRYRTFYWCFNMKQVSISAWLPWQPSARLPWLRLFISNKSICHNSNRYLMTLGVDVSILGK